MRTTLFGSLVLLFLSGAFGANLVPNSSFELGTGRGWTYWKEKDNAGSPITLKAALVGGAQHGNRCVSITGDYSVHSKPIYLTAGVVYTLTYYAKSSPGPDTFTTEISQMGDINNGTRFSIAPPTSWTHYTHQFTPPVSYWFFVNFFHRQPSLTAFIDTVQLEVGGVSSSYGPQATVEVGLECTNAYNVIFGDQPRAVQLSIWNNGGTTTTNRTFVTTYDLWNRTRSTGTYVNVVAPGLTTTNISLLVTGWNRVTVRTAAMNSWDEITANVLPFPAKSTVLRTNGMFGTHGNYDSNQLANLRKVGYTWTRSLSPAFNLFRWHLIEPSQGNFQWQPDIWYNVFSTNGLAPLAMLSPLDFTAPSWSTNGAGVLNVPAFSNYCWQAVNRYKHLIKHWDIWNEPHQSGIPWIMNSANYATVLAAGAKAVKAADATAKVVGLGGSYDAVWARAVWDAMSPGDQALVDIITCHLYPNDNDQYDDQNQGSVDTRPFTFKTQFAATGKEIWNTESGTASRGGYLTENAIWGYRWQSAYDLDQQLRPEEMARSLKSVNRITREWARCFGNGMRNCFYYDNRQPTHEMMDLTHLTGWELLSGNGHNPVSISLQIMAWMIDEFSTGYQFAHTTSSNPEMYIFGKGTTNVVIAFNFDRINRLLTVTNTGFTQFDVMGNVVNRLNPTKVIVTATPQYFWTTTMSLAQLQQTFTFATVASQADTNPPGLSVDIAPSGSWPGGGGLIKWTAWDDTYWTIGTGQDTKTNVAFAYKWDSGTYGPLSATNYYWTTIAPGNRVFWVKAVDRVGNIAETAYHFNPDTTGTGDPPPGDPPPTTPIAATVTPSRIRGK